jgi:hypothetical protein
MKNWLIRTKNNHILGPVTKQKVLELFENGSIKEEDEICSGNGYWFYVREEDLLNKYLLGSTDQFFNPVTEANSVLTQDPVEEVVELHLQETPLSGSENLPSDADLEYPDLDDMAMDLTHDEPEVEAVVASEETVDNVVNLSQSSNAKIEKVKPSYAETDLKPEFDNVDLTAPIHRSDFKNDFTAPELPPRVAKRSILTINMLIGLIFIFLMMLATAIYFRGSIINAIKNVQFDNPFFIQKVYAQESEVFIQKKS